MKQGGALAGWGAGLGCIAVAAAVSQFGVREERPVARTPPPSVEFIVRFEESHPLARAQEAYGADPDRAEALARKSLPRDKRLAGLCFDHFTLGGAEIVLTPCAAPAPAERARVSADWTKKLRAHPGVDYADANVMLAPQAP